MNTLRGIQVCQIIFQNWYKIKVNIIKKRKKWKKNLFWFFKACFRVIYFARSLLKPIKYDVLVALLYIECWSFCMDVSYSSDEENLNVQSSDDLDIEVESFTGYGNEPEYTEQEISK